MAAHWITWWAARARGPDTENWILTYYDEPVAAPGRAVVDWQSWVPANGPLSTLDRSRPDDSTTRYGYWYRPPCRCPSPACRIPPIPIWTISICVALDLVPSCIGPRRTAIDLHRMRFFARGIREMVDNILTKDIFKAFRFQYNSYYTIEILRNIDWKLIDPKSASINWKRIFSSICRVYRTLNILILLASLIFQHWYLYIMSYCFEL